MPRGKCAPDLLCQIHATALDFKGPAPDYVIVQGENALDGYFFDLTTDKSGVDVPQGDYKLVCGRVSKGKRGQMAKA